MARALPKSSLKDSNLKKKYFEKRTDNFAKAYENQKLLLNASQERMTKFLFKILHMPFVSDHEHF